MRGGRSSDWPLTQLGKKQAELTGEWLRLNIGQEFDLYFVSDYPRALETASLLGFSDAKWQVDPALRERNWGGLEHLPHPEREAALRAAHVSPIEDSLDWCPPNGESMAHLLRKVRPFRSALASASDNRRALIVSHGGPIQALRCDIWKVGEEGYASFIGGNNHVRNCHVFNYVDDPNGCLIERSVFLDWNSSWVETIRQVA